MISLTKRFSGFRLMALAGLSAVSLLAGCSGILPSGSVAAPTQALKLSGSVHGGQQPVTGAHVYLFGVGGFVYGSGSNSLLNNGTADSSGNQYVVTDANGAFNISSDYTCPSYNTNLSTYLLAVGGNPGLAAGTNNTAITLIAALGPCAALTQATFVDVNEISTAASVTAMQQFMVDETHVGAPTNPNTNNPTGIPNAMLTVTNLENIASGQALAAPATGSGTSPQLKLNTLGDILAPCINSTGPASTACAALFTATTPAGGTAPTTVVGAMLQIAQNPGRNVATLYGQTNAMAPFQPTLTTAPNDFTLGITYTGGGLTFPGALAIDSTGDVFTANCPTCNGSTATDSLVGFSPAGAVLTGTAGFTTNIHKPTAIAFNKYSGLWSTNLASGTTPDQVNLLDTSGNEEYSFPVSFSTFGSPNGIAIDSNLNAWVTNPTKNSIVKVNLDDTNPNITVTPGGFTNPKGVAVDGFGNVYAVGTGSSSIAKFDQSGNLLSGTGAGYTGGGLSSPVNLAIDGGQHLWTVNTGTTKSVTELFGYDGTADSSTTGYTGINQATNISIDGAGTAWIANCRVGCSTSGSTAADNIVHLSAAGVSLTPSDGIQNLKLAAPTATAIDYSGNLWISNSTGASLTELVGVAVPVVTDLNYAVQNNLLPAANLLLNPGFENGNQGTTIPNWTLTSTGTATYQSTIGYTEGGGHTGYNTLTEGTGQPYTADENQTVSVANGKYLVSCFAEGSNGQTTVSLSVSGYDTAGSTSTVNILPTVSTNYFTLYSIPNVTVTNGSITINLNTSSTSGGGYMHFDDCSITKQ